jgi:hypothetical protein
MADLAMVQPNSSGRLAAGMLALGLVAGCGGEGRVQELPPGAFDADALPELAFVEELRIGSVDDPDAGFSRIGAVTTLPDGRVLVLEALDRQVRIYGAEGRLERTIGRAGDGPGEFQGPLRFGMLADTLWVADLGSGRITLLDLEGRVLETLRADPVPVDVGIDGIRGLAHPARLRPDGLVETDWRMTAGNDVEADSIFWPELLLDRAGAVVDTLRMNRHPWPPTPMARIGTFSFGLSPPFPTVRSTRRWGRTASPSSARRPPRPGRPPSPSSGKGPRATPSFNARSRIVPAPCPRSGGRRGSRSSPR